MMDGDLLGSRGDSKSIADGVGDIAVCESPDGAAELVGLGLLLLSAASLSGVCCMLAADRAPNSSCGSASESASESASQRTRVCLARPPLAFLVDDNCEADDNFFDHIFEIRGTRAVLGEKRNATQRSAARDYAFALALPS
jgi:hypothetical protein